MRPVLHILAAALLAAGAAPVANAADDVVVALAVDHSPLGGQGTADRCDVTVPVGADGVAVLDAAKADGCIDDYTLTYFGASAFVECLDGAGPMPNLCTTCPPPYAACGYWSLWIDDGYASGGVGSFRAGENGKLAFEFSAFPLDLVPGP